MSLVLAGDTRSLGDGSPYLVVLGLGRALALLNHAFCDFPHCEDDLPGLTHTTPPSDLNTDSMAVFRLRLEVGGRTEDKAAVTTLQRAESPGRKCHFVVKSLLHPNLPRVVSLLGPLVVELGFADAALAQSKAFLSGLKLVDDLLVVGALLLNLLA